MFFSSALIKIFFLQIYRTSNDNQTKRAQGKIERKNGLTEFVNKSDFSRNIKRSSIRRDEVVPSLKKSNFLKSLSYKGNFSLTYEIDIELMQKDLIFLFEKRPYVRKFLENVIEWAETYNLLREISMFDYSNEVFKMLCHFTDIITTETKVSEKITEDLEKKSFEIERKENELREILYEV